ncbi:MAG: TonB-dependent receptor [Nitrospirae bacterium]|nr:TonB-dependent receptor [Nitrospirota bacterium]
MKRKVEIFTVIVAALVSLLVVESSYGEIEAKKNASGQTLEEIVVSGSRESEPLKEMPKGIGIVKKEEIQAVKPAQPSEILNRVPGVWVAPTAGEGHMTAIRQPLNTSPVYLYLEDGVPIRSTGFFNHNALYEMNLPAAQRIEVIKGPATALYGSDAIGGTINVLTRPAPTKLEFDINPEVGGYGWYRLLATGGDTWDKNGVRLDLNVTHSDGWRQRTGYDRQGGTARWDKALSETSTLKTVISFFNIDQKTGGANGLLKADYNQKPYYNYQTFDFRKVKAFRVSTEFEKDLGGGTLVSLIPYFRENEMNLLPGWGIFKSGSSYYGYESTTRFYSLGLLSKYRHDFSTLKTRLIAGIDIDYSPGQYDERRLQAFKTGDQFTSYSFVTNTNNNYDFDAAFKELSPYVQTESTPFEKMRVTLGARYDNLAYGYSTNLAPNSNRPDNTDRYFSHISPKVGFTYEFAKELNAFASYTNGFRAPSANDLFRGSSGTASTSVKLKPIKVDSYEAGFRGVISEVLSYEISAYLMQKEDDLVSYSPATNVTQRLNAGKTEHKGVEIGFGIQPVKELRLDTSYSHATHKYVDYVASSSVNYSGKEMSLAPRDIVDVRLAYIPSTLNGGRMEFEWIRLGSYWMNDANTEKYNGHDIFNFRTSYNINKQWELYGRVMNIANRLYAYTATKSGSDPALYCSGAPRTLFVGLTYRFGQTSNKEDSETGK